LTLKHKGITIKTLLSFFVILLLSSAQAQLPEEDIKHAIADWFSNTGGQLVNIIQFRQANPCKKLVDKYRPKQAYCVTCKTIRLLRKVQGYCTLGVAA
jgi:hypothetical protein